MYVNVITVALRGEVGIWGLTVETDMKVEFQRRQKLFGSDYSWW